MPIGIEDYFCVTSMGVGPQSLISSLIEGRVVRDKEGVARIPKKLNLENETSEERLVGRLLECWQELQIPALNGRIGVLLASTKGMLEDFIWSSSPQEKDPLTPLLEKFILKTQLKPRFRLCVSNACASSHGAFFIAQRWLESQAVDRVVVLAVDEIGPFIFKGFTSLGALSATQAKPFSTDRDGLQLGEAAAVIVFSREESAPFKLWQVAIDTEGHSITRPSPSGRSLAFCCREIQNSVPVFDAIIAHGTATRANDLAEDQCFTELFMGKVPITATKWCVGHTLGVSGAIDLIAGLESLKRKTLFPIATLNNPDPLFSNSYVQSPIPLSQESQILITSLGFGGTHAALAVGR